LFTSTLAFTQQRAFGSNLEDLRQQKKSRASLTVSHFKPECKIDELLVLFSDRKRMIVLVQPLPAWLVNILLCHVNNCFHCQRILSARNEPRCRQEMSVTWCVCVWTA